MKNKDKSFSAGPGIEHAVNLLHQEYADPRCLPGGFPNSGIGEISTLDLLAPHVLGRAAHLFDSNALAHMDPPTPWIKWATSLWKALPETGARSET